MNALLTPLTFAERQRLVADSADLAAEITSLRRVINRQSLRLAASSELQQPLVAELKIRLAKDKRSPRVP